MIKKYSRKLITLTSALVLATFASTASAAICITTAWKLDQNTSAPDFYRSNVPTCDGDFVSGFQVIDGGNISWYADAQHADRCFNVDVTFLPADVSAYDIEAATEFLGFTSVDVFRKVEVACRAR